MMETTGRLDPRARRVRRKALFVLLVGGFALLQAGGAPSASAAPGDEVYFEDFDTVGTQAGTEWSFRTVSTTPTGGRAFLGELGNQTAELQLEDLPAHTGLQISYDLLAIRTLDGNAGPDLFEMKVDGFPQRRTTFANWPGNRQAYPQSHPGGDNDRRTGADEFNSLGYQWSGEPMDAVYQISETVYHTGGSARLRWSMSGLEALENESWGLDNVVITLADVPPPAGIHVTTTQDELDDGMTGEGCSLREAMQSVNTNSPVGGCEHTGGMNTIYLGPHTYTLSIAGRNENANQTGDLDVNTRYMSIVGSGAGQTTIDANDIDRVLEVRSYRDNSTGTYPERFLSLRDATITGGLVNSGDYDGAAGGGISAVRGGLVIRDSVITGNREQSGQWGGGGVSNSGGTLEMYDSVISHNMAYARGGGLVSTSSYDFAGSTTTLERVTVVGNGMIGQGSGGGIHADNSAIRVTDSMFTGNQSRDRDGSAIHVNGRAVGTFQNITVTGNDCSGCNWTVLVSAAQATFRNSTIARNGGDNGLYNLKMQLCGPCGQEGQTTLINTVIADHPTDCGTRSGGGFDGDQSGTGLVLQGGNLIETPGSFPCTYSGATDQLITGEDPQLQALADNGGATETMALSAASPALDAGDPADPGTGGAACKSTDQRGVTRPGDGDGDPNTDPQCDIGAWEWARYRLRVDPEAGGAISSTPAGIDCGTDCGEVYDAGTEVTLVATPPAGEQTRWSGCSPGADPNSCTVRMDDNVDVGADFLRKYTLSVSKPHKEMGSVISTPGGIDCGTDCSGQTAQFWEGETVQLVATAADGYDLSSWDGCSGGITFCSVEMDGDKTVTANFVVEPPPPPEVEANTPSISKSGFQKALVDALKKQGDPVDVIFGSFSHGHVDLTIPGVGPRVGIERTYNSATASRDSVLGYGWTFAYDMAITTPDPDTVALRWSDGRVDLYTVENDGSLTAPTGSPDELVAKAGGGWKLTTEDEVERLFGPGGRLLSITDPDGNAVTFVYDGDGDGDLTTITDASGRVWTLDHDDAGRITSVSDPAARSVSYEYTDGDLARVTNPAGGQTTYEYDDQHRLTRMTDANGNLYVAHEYGPDGRVVEQTDSRGVHTFVYLDGRTIYTDPTGAETVTHYDESYRVTKTVDGLGGATLYTYDADGFLVSSTDPEGGVTAYTYDADGNVVSITDPEGNESTGTYDADGHVLTQTNARGHTATYAYDGEGHPVSMKDALSNETTFEYGDRGLLTKVIDPAGHQTVFAYDTFGNRTSVTRPDGETTAFDHDDAGRVVSVTDPLGHETTTQYNALDLPLSQTAPDQGTVEFTYDAVGNLTSVEDALDHTSTMVYSDAYDVVSVTDALTRQTTYGYDNMGRQTSVTFPDGETWTTQYDALGRMTERTSPLGRTWTYEYDAAGRVTSLDVPGSRDWEYEYDPAGRLVLVADAMEEETDYEYDGTGNVVSMNDARGNITTYAYDELDRLVEETNAIGDTQTWAFNARGLLSSRTNGEGETVTFTHDEMGRLTGWTAGSDSATFAYDELGRRTQMTDGTGSTSYGYDDAGRLTEVTSPRGTVGYAYDEAGRRTQMTQPDLMIEYAFDDANQLTEVTSSEGDLVGYGYDAAGRLLSETFGNGVVTDFSYDDDGRATRLRSTRSGAVLEDIRYTLDAAGNRTAEEWNGGSATYTYDDMAQLTAAVLDLPARDLSYAFAYDEVGNRLSQTMTDTEVPAPPAPPQPPAPPAEEPPAGPGGPNPPPPDPAPPAVPVPPSTNPPPTNVPPAEQEPEPKPKVKKCKKMGKKKGGAKKNKKKKCKKKNGSGRRMSTTTSTAAWSATTRGSMAASGSTLSGPTTTTYEYDDANQLVSINGSAVTYDRAGRLTSDGTTTYGYDALSRLISSSAAGGATFGYDGDGNRVSETAGGVTSTHLFDLAGSLPMRISTTSGGDTVSFVTGMRRVATVGPAGTRFEHADALGSLRLMTDEAGAESGTGLFSPFGERLEGMGASGFTGEPHGGGLVHLRSREYSPSLGRFLTPDILPPVTLDPTSFHEFAYVRNDPINATDPTGMCDSFQDCLNRAGEWVGEQVSRFTSHLGEASSTKSMPSRAQISAFSQLISDKGLGFAAQVISVGGGNVISVGGGNVISVGGGNVISVGGLNFSPQQFAALRQALAGVISVGGGNVISVGGGNFSVAAGVISVGGGNFSVAAGVISVGGGNVISTGGLN